MEMVGRILFSRAAGPGDFFGFHFEEIAGDANDVRENHSIRGFVSRHVTKKLGLKVESTQSEAGERTYRIVS